MMTILIANDNIAVYLFDTVLTSYIQSPKSLAYAKTTGESEMLHMLLMESIATA